MFSAEELIRYSRQIMMPEIGFEGQQKLHAAKVLVAGAGGLGCPLLQYLTASGVGHIGIVDFDTVEAHNLHRQILYTSNDIGKPKAIVAAERIKQMNPHIQVSVFNELLSESNAEQIISQFDIVADGTDNFPARYLVNDTCVKLNKPLVYGSILRFEGQLAVFNYNGSKNLRDIFPEPPDAEDVPTCGETGIIGTVPGLIGTYMCDLVQKIILEKPVEVNTLLMVDLNTYSIQKLKY